MCPPLSVSDPGNSWSRRPHPAQKLQRQLTFLLQETQCRQYGDHRARSYTTGRASLDISKQKPVLQQRERRSHGCGISIHGPMCDKLINSQYSVPVDLGPCPEVPGNLPADLAGSWPDTCQLTCRTHTRKLPGTGRALAKYLPEACRKLAGYLAGNLPATCPVTCRTLPGDVPDTCRILVGYLAGNLPGTCRVTCRRLAGHLPGTCRTLAGNLPGTCRVTCRKLAGNLPATCRTLAGN